MRISKLQLIGLVIGSLLLGSVASVSAQETNKPRARMAKGFHGAVRGELVVPFGDGFREVRIDRGTLESVDGSAVKIKEADGTSVTIDTSDDTRVSRDGQGAELADLRPGDQVFALRAIQDGGLKAETVRAISPKRQQERHARREECRQDRSKCKELRKGR